MRVLAGGPTRETDSAMFRLHCEGLRAQEGWLTYEKSLSVTVHHELVPDPGGPRWHHEKIRAVARARQSMMERALWECPWHAAESYRGCRCGDPDHVGKDVDALFMCDTDLILGPGVLERMWAVDADVVFGTFWTRDNWGQPESSDVAPQVWWTHPYDWRDPAAISCWNALCEPGVNEVEVLGGGACTLIRGRGFESHYWPLLESLQGAGRLWPGEDRTYCLGLEARGIRMVAVTGLPIVHLYDQSLRTPAKLAEARKLVGLP